MLILGRLYGERVRVRVAGVDVWLWVNKGPGGELVKVVVDGDPARVDVRREELLPPAERWRPREGR